MDAFPTALDVAAAIRSRELSATEALEETLRRVDAVDPHLNAITWRDDDDARRAGPGGRRPRGVEPARGPATVLRGAHPHQGPHVGGGLADHLRLGRCRRRPHRGERARRRGPRTGRRSSWPAAATPRSSGPSRRPRTCATASPATRGTSTAHPRRCRRAGHPPPPPPGCSPSPTPTTGAARSASPPRAAGWWASRSAGGRVPALAQAWEGGLRRGCRHPHRGRHRRGARRHLGSRPARLVERTSARCARSPRRSAPRLEPLRVALVTDTRDRAAHRPGLRGRRPSAPPGRSRRAGHTVVDVPTGLPHRGVRHPLRDRGEHRPRRPTTTAVDWSQRRGAQPAEPRGSSAQVDSIAYAEAVAALQRWTRRVNAQWGARVRRPRHPDDGDRARPGRPGARRGAGRSRAASRPPSSTPCIFTAVFNMNGLPASRRCPVHQSPCRSPASASRRSSPAPGRRPASSGCPQPGSEQRPPLE